MVLPNHVEVAEVQAMAGRQSSLCVCGGWVAGSLKVGGWCWVVSLNTYISVSTHHKQEEGIKHG